ncbi:MAG TPA: hypothetical protein VKB42_18985 [Dongiaceae bacterium]|nr:hypothetical protein [Dongiaceae bacterium]
MELRDGNGTGKQSLAAHCNGESAVNKTRRKVLMQEAFDLLSRASALRRVDADNDEIDRGFSIEEECYRMRLSNGDGTTLWVYLQAESRADAIWAAYVLGRACSDCFEDFDLWDGLHHLLSADTKFTSFFSDSAEEVAAASQQFLLDTEETLLRSEIAVARSRKLLEATAALRDRLTRAGN